jgi:hypothetical protein
VASEITAEDLNGLRKDMRSLARSVDAQRQDAETERTYARRTRNMLYLTLASLVFDLILTAFVTYFSVSANDASSQARHAVALVQQNQQTQYQSCLDGNNSRQTLESFFVGIFDQNLAQLKANPTNLPPAIIKQQTDLVGQYIAKTHQAFDPKDCSALPH